MYHSQEASHIFADYTLSRIDPDVRAGMTTEQLQAVRAALIAQAMSERHALDIRLQLPLFLRKYYLVVFFGRDRRRNTLAKEVERVHNTPRPVRQLMYGLALSSFFFALGLSVFTGLYMLKSALGIDLFPNLHLRDLLMMAINFLDPAR